MKISYKWICEFVDLDASAEEIAEALTMSGIEVEDVDHQTVHPDLLVARIVEVQPHPNADKLRLCKVDAGQDELLDVVCGAPNARLDLTTVLAPVGCVLGEGMKVKRAKIRGVESNGVLLSEKEIGLSDDHSGIFELDGDITPGTPLAQALDLEDWVLEVAVTPNRGDCLSMIGLARELSAIYRTGFRLPETTIKTSARKLADNLSVTVDEPEGCPRYAARMAEVTIAPSPFLMRRRLYLAGIRAINNVVDVTNYILLELGQPMHAFDSRFVEGGAINVRRASKGERFITLDSEERILGEDDLLICDGVKPVALAGVMGGENSEVNDATTRVILESAFFNPVMIRRTSKRLGLMSESSYRFERGIDPENQVLALDRAAHLLQKYAGAEVYDGCIDENCYVSGDDYITLRRGTLKRVLGIDTIGDDDVSGILTRLGCTVNADDAGWQVLPPAFRHDIEREIDLVEEVIRVYGMDAVKPQLPSFRPRKVTHDDQPLRCLRNYLAAAGLTEVVNYSFISPRFTEWFGEKVLELKNPISDEMRNMRTSLVPGLLQTVAKNIHLQQRSMALFELGHRFVPGEGQGLPVETETVTIGLCGQRRPQHWAEPASAVDFYDIKGYAELLIPGMQCRPGERPYLKPGVQADILVDDQVVGCLGAVHADLLETLDIDEDVFVLELDAEAALVRSWDGMQGLSRFPSTARDLSLVADEGVSCAQIRQLIGDLTLSDLRNVEVIDFYEGEKLPAGKKGITVRLTYQSDDRTLKDKQINKWQETVIKALDSGLGVALRQ